MIECGPESVERIPLETASQLAMDHPADTVLYAAPDCAYLVVSQSSNVEGLEAALNTIERTQAGTVISKFDYNHRSFASPNKGAMFTGYSIYPKHPIPSHELIHPVIDAVTFHDPNAVVIHPKTIPKSMTRYADQKTLQRIILTKHIFFRDVDGKNIFVLTVIQLPHRTRRRDQLVVGVEVQTLPRLECLILPDGMHQCREGCILGNEILSLFGVDRFTRQVDWDAIGVTLEDLR